MVGDTDYSLTFNKAMEGMGGAMYQALLGSAHSSTPTWYAQINLVSIGVQTRVMAQATVRMQNAFGREDVQDFSQGKAGHELMDLLLRVKDHVEASEQQIPSQEIMD